jgi:hypothetical protein
MRILIIELDSLQFKRESVNNCDEFDAITKKASRGRRREFEAGTRPVKKKKEDTFQVPVRFSLPKASRTSFAKIPVLHHLPNSTR